MSEENEIEKLVKQAGPKRVINDEVDITARSANEIIALDKYARSKKKSVKKVFRSLGVSKRSSPDSLGRS